MDRLTAVLLFAGLGCFGLAFVLSASYPHAITDAGAPITTVDELAKDVSVEFKNLKNAYPVAFSEFPNADQTLTPRELIGVRADDPRRAESDAAWERAYAHALRRGRDRYIAEACWHCHSQFVRPTANEAQRYGPVQTPAHDNNELQRPVLRGTRRIGPDLTHEGGKRSNDWHVAHLWDPESTSPDSVMPPYPWLFQEGFQIRRTIDPESADRGGLPADRSYCVPGVYPTRADADAAMVTYRESLPDALEEEAERLFVADRARGPNAEGLAVIAYLQWLGTWQPTVVEEGIQFAGVHLMPYCLVACGFLALLAHAFLKGHFADIERPKFEIIDRERAYDLDGTLSAVAPAAPDRR